MAAMVSQNIVNLVDTAMVGTLGDSALAAVGLGGFASFLSISLVTGFSSSVQALSSRRMGEKRDPLPPLYAALFSAAIGGIMLSLLLFPNLETLFAFLNDDPAVVRQGRGYLEPRILAIAFAGFNFSFRGYWNGTSQSGVYMRTLIITHIANVILNYLLIFGKFGLPELGVAGAGWSTSISHVIGFSIYLTTAARRLENFRLRLPARKVFSDLISQTIPSGIRQMFFSAGFLILYWIIGNIGTRQLAAANVLINITLVAILPIMGMGMGAATLVGNALGRSEPDEARRWGWDAVKLSSTGIFFIGLPVFLFPEFFLSVFLHDSETLALAILPMRLTAISMSLDAVGLVLMNALLGAGDTRRVMLISFSFQWLFFLPLAYLTGPIMNFGLTEIWVLQGLYRLMQGLVFFFFWKGSKWSRVQFS